MLRVALLALAGLAGCSFTPGRFVPGDGATDTQTNGTGDSASDTVTSDGMPPPITFVQAAAHTNTGSNPYASVSFMQLQTAGNLNIVVVSWSDQNDAVFSVIDSQFNTYYAATTLMQAQGFSQRVYYAPNIKAGTNLVQATMTNNTSSPKIRVFEYSGLATTLPADDVQAANGSTSTAMAGPVNTTHANDLLFAAEVGNTNAMTAGSGFMQRQLDNGDMVADRIVGTTGAYSASISLAASGGWILQLVSFKGQ